MSAEVPRHRRALPSPARDSEREELARSVARSAYIFAMQLTGNAETAHEIAQDSLLRFFQHLDRFDASRPVEPWLYQIVRNRVRDVKRREGLRRHESLDTMRLQGYPESIDPSADPAADAERSELQRRIWQAVSQLTEAHREILVLRDYHDLSYREIAEVLSIPPGTVMSRLHAARKNLRELLITERGPYPGDPPNRRGDQ